MVACLGPTIGFPRTLAQAEKLDAHLEEIGVPLDLVLNLDVPESIILGRITDRWIHEPSGRTYNLKYNPPKKTGVDDVTGDSLVKREDDDLVCVSCLLIAVECI
jgi:nucleoside-triphosphate--adenylate kinase